MRRKAKSVFLQILLLKCVKTAGFVVPLTQACLDTPLSFQWTSQPATSFNYQFFDPQLAINLPVVSFSDPAMAVACSESDIQVSIQVTPIESFTGADPWLSLDATNNRMLVYESTGRADETLQIVLTAQMGGGHSNFTPENFSFEVVGTKPTVCSSSWEPVTLGDPTSDLSPVYTDGDGVVTYPITGWAVTPGIACSESNLVLTGSCTISAGSSSLAYLQPAADWTSITYSPSVPIVERIVYTCTVTAKLTNKNPTFTHFAVFTLTANPPCKNAISNWHANTPQPTTLAYDYILGEPQESLTLQLDDTVLNEWCAGATIIFGFSGVQESWITFGAQTLGTTSVQWYTTDPTTVSLKFTVATQVVITHSVSTFTLSFQSFKITVQPNCLMQQSPVSFVAYAGPLSYNYIWSQLGDGTSSDPITFDINPTPVASSLCQHSDRTFTRSITSTDYSVPSPITSSPTSVTPPFVFTWYSSAVRLIPVTYTITVTCSITTGLGVQTETITILLNVSVPTCSEAREQLVISVPSTFWADTEFWDPAAEVVVDPAHLLGITGTQVCSLTDLTVSTTIVTTATNQYWFDTDANPDTYIRHKLLADGSYDFTGGLPFEYNFQVGRFTETMTVTLVFSITNELRTVSKSMYWKLYIGQSCDESTEAVTFVDNGTGFKRSEAATSYLPSSTSSPIKHFWALNDVALQPSGYRYNRVFFEKYQTVQTSTTYCTYRHVTYTFSLSLIQVPGSSFDVTQPSTFFDNFFSEVTNELTDLSLVLDSDYGELSWTFDETKVYDSVIVHVKLKGKIVNANPTTPVWIANPKSFYIRFDPPPCQYSPEDVQIGGEVSVLQQFVQFALFTEDPFYRSFELDRFVVTNSLSCYEPDIVYSYETDLDPIDFAFDPDRLKFTVLTDNLAMLGVHDVVMIGTIYRPTWGPVVHKVKFQLEIVHPCDLPEIVLTDYQTSYKLNYQAGDEDKIVLSQVFNFGDTYDGQTCWRTQWTYKLIDKQNPLLPVPRVRDPLLLIQYSFMNQTRLFEFYAHEESPTQTFKFELQVSRRKGELLQRLPITLTVYEKLNPFVTVEPNENSPQLRNGLQFNETTINLAQLDVNQIELGEPFDDDQQDASETILVVFIVDPPTGDITLDKNTGVLKFNFLKLFAAAEAQDLRFRVSVVLTDSNAFPRTTQYQLTVLVPQTTKEVAQDNEAYASELQQDFESKVVRNPFDQLGEIGDIEISETGLLRLTFSTKLSSESEARELFASYLFIKLKSSSETNKEQKTFKTQLVSARTSEILIQIVFDNPLLISDGSKLSRDQLEVTMIKPRFQVVTSEVPTQASSKRDAEMVAAFVETVKQGSNTILATTVALNLLMRASFSHIWGMINSVQLISYMMLYALSFPQNAQSFFEVIQSLSEFDVVPIDDVTSGLFPFLDEFVHNYLEEPGRKLQKKGSGGSSKGKDKSVEDEVDSSQMTEEEAKNRLGKILLTILIIAIILPLMGIFWFGRRLCPCFKSAFDSLFYGLFFNQSSRFILESYTPLMQTLLENLHRGLNWSTLIYICLSANDVAFSIIYGLFPLAVTVYFYRKQDKFKKVWFRKRWEEIMGNLTWRRKSSAFYIAIFCYRRLLAALLVVFLADFPWAQVMLTVFFNQNVVIAMGLSSPFRYRSERILDFLNEANIMLCAYHLFLFTDFVPDPLRRSQAGFSMIIFTTLNMMINLGLAAFTTACEVRRSAAMKWLKRRLQARQKIEKQTGVKVPVTKEQVEEEVIFPGFDFVDSRSLPYRRFAQELDEYAHVQIRLGERDLRREIADKIDPTRAAQIQAGKEELNEELQRESSQLRLENRLLESKLARQRLQPENKVLTRNQLGSNSEDKQDVVSVHSSVYEATPRQNIQKPKTGETQLVNLKLRKQKGNHIKNKVSSISAFSKSTHDLLSGISATSQQFSIFQKDQRHADNKVAKYRKTDELVIKEDALYDNKGVLVTPENPRGFDPEIIQNIQRFEDKLREMRKNRGSQLL